MDVTGINPQPSVAGVHREDADIGGDIQIRQPASASDGVSISEQAEQVKKAMRAAQDSPDPRSEQVIRLKQAISTAHTIFRRRVWPSRLSRTGRALAGSNLFH